MKVTVPFSYDGEMDVDVTADDIEAMLSERAADMFADESQLRALRLLNAVGVVLTGVSDKAISALNAKQREVVRVFLSEQSARYSAPKDGGDQ